MKVTGTKKAQIISKTILDDDKALHVLSVEWQEDSGSDAIIMFDGKPIVDASIMRDLVKDFLDRCPMAFESEDEQQQ